MNFRYIVVDWWWSLQDFAGDDSDLIGSKSRAVTFFSCDVERVHNAQTKSTRSHLYDSRSPSLLKVHLGQTILYQQKIHR